MASGDDALNRPRNLLTAAWSRRAPELRCFPATEQPRPPSSRSARDIHEAAQKDAVPYAICKILFRSLTAKRIVSSVAATGLKRLLEKFRYRSIEFFRHFFIWQVPNPF